MAEPPPHVVIAGGGVAALEALIALRELAGDRVRITLLAPERDFVYRPMSVAEPFALGHAERHRLADIARDFGAELVAEPLEAVHPDRRRVVTGVGTELEYDSLLLAIGARGQAVFRNAITFGAEGAPEALSGLLADLEQGYARRVAFVLPSTTAWSLPLYELAIMTARQVWGMGIDGVELFLVTPEERPLDVFGPEPSAMVAELLAAEGIEFVGSSDPDVRHGAVLAGSREIAADRTVTLPVPAGPGIRGVPQDAGGFVPVDAHARVEGLDGVYAAGDMTTLPIKQGGLAAQQAVAAAQAIAARHGADVTPEPFRPVLRGMLLTAGPERWLRGPVSEATPPRADLNPLWWPPTKIATRYLAPYLVGHDEAGRLDAPPAGAVRIERELEPHDAA